MVSLFAVQSASAMVLRYRLTPRTALVLQGPDADLTKWVGDAIVNAANERMLGGGGVDGAIHRAAGGELRAACAEYPEVKPGVRCPTGEARITRGFHLPATHVIHTVGPIYSSAKESGPLLASAYRSSLALANEHKLRTVAFPAISCGVFCYPYDEAAEIALGTCKEAAGDMEEVHFVMFEDEPFSAWKEVADRTLEPLEAAAEKQEL